MYLTALVAVGHPRVMEARLVHHAEVRAQVARVRLIERVIAVLLGCPGGRVRQLRRLANMTRAEIIRLRAGRPCGGCS